MVRSAHVPFKGGTIILLQLQRRSLFVVGLLFIALLAVACGGGGSGATLPDNGGGGNGDTGGDGGAPVAGECTREGPCVITTLEQLAAIGEFGTDLFEYEGSWDGLERHYELGADIDASATAEWTDDFYNDGFIPIGRKSSHIFTGTFDGKGYKITGLHIDSSSGDGIALFEEIGPEAEIRNVALEEVDIVSDASRADVGALVGTNRGKIENASVSGTVTVTDGSQSGAITTYTGGLVGV